MAGRAKAAMGADRLDVLADRGYFDEEEVLACEGIGVTPYVPKPLTSGDSRRPKEGHTRRESTGQGLSKGKVYGNTRSFIRFFPTVSQCRIGALSVSCAAVGALAATLSPVGVSRRPSGPSVTSPIISRRKRCEERTGGASPRESALKMSISRGLRRMAHVPLEPRYRRGSTLASRDKFGSE